MTDEEVAFVQEQINEWEKDNSTVITINADMGFQVCGWGEPYVALSTVGDAQHDRTFHLRDGRTMKIGVRR